MNRSVGISFVVLLSLIYCADLVLATKVCLLRKSETVKCSARGVHLDEAETVRLDKAIKGVNIVQEGINIFRFNPHFRPSSRPSVTSLATSSPPVAPWSTNSPLSAPK